MKRNGRVVRRKSCANLYLCALQFLCLNKLSLSSELHAVVSLPDPNSFHRSSLRSESLTDLRASSSISRPHSGHGENSFFNVPTKYQEHEFGQANEEYQGYQQSYNGQNHELGKNYAVPIEMDHPQTEIEKEQRPYSGSINRPLLSGQLRGFDESHFDPPNLDIGGPHYEAGTSYLTFERTPHPNRELYKIRQQFPSERRPVTQHPREGKISITRDRVVQHDHTPSGHKPHEVIEVIMERPASSIQHAVQDEQPHHSQYVTQVQEERPRYISHEQQESPQYISHEQHGRPQHISHDQQERPQYISHEQQERPRYISHEQQESPQYISHEQQEHPRYISHEQHERPQHISHEPQERPQYISHEQQERPQHISHEQQERPQHISHEQQERPQHISHEQQERPQHISHEQQERPQHISHEQQERPQYISHDPEERPRYISNEQPEHSQYLNQKPQNHPNQQNQPQYVSHEHQERPQYSQEPQVHHQYTSHQQHDPLQQKEPETQQVRLQYITTHINHENDPQYQRNPHGKPEHSEPQQGSAENLPIQYVDQDGRPLEIKYQDDPREKPKHQMVEHQHANSENPPTRIVYVPVPSNKGNGHPDQQNPNPTNLGVYQHDSTPGGYYTTQTKAISANEPSRAVEQLHSDSSSSYSYKPVVPGVYELSSQKESYPSPSPYSSTNKEHDIQITKPRPEILHYDNVDKPSSGYITASEPKTKVYESPIPANPAPSIPKPPTSRPSTPARAKKRRPTTTESRKEKIFSGSYSYPVTTDGTTSRPLPAEFYQYSTVTSHVGNDKNEGISQVLSSKPRPVLKVVKPPKIAAQSKVMITRPLKSNNNKERLRHVLTPNPESKPPTNGAIPGEPGTDYPIMKTLPQPPSFSCRGKSAGFYTDPQHRCQVYYQCSAAGDQQGFLCPNGTVFNQVSLVCEWWYNVDCQNSARHYERNTETYQSGDQTYRERPKSSKTSRSVHVQQESRIVQTYHQGRSVQEALHSDASIFVPVSAINNLPKSRKSRTID